MNGAPLLEARGLNHHFALKGDGLFARTRGVVRAVDGVDIAVHAGETVALVGESGCGKTTLARALALLVKPTAGSVLFAGADITHRAKGELRSFRRAVQMVFQDPYGSLNPRLPVGTIVAEPLVIHGIGTAVERRERTRALVRAVGLAPGDIRRYPHQFSGGQRQRIAIARALALEPRLIIADEPVSALDVSVQSQVLNLMQDVQDAHGLAYLLISHDLAVVRHVADRVYVMYLGRIVEEAPAEALFADPRHPYTRALMAAAPKIGRGKRTRRPPIAGDVPSATQPPSGCPFHPRCPRAEDLCRRVAPEFAAVAGKPDQAAACHFRDEAAS